MAKSKGSTGNSAVIGNLVAAATRKTGITKTAGQRQVFATYAYFLRTKCGITKDGDDGLGSWSVLEAKNVGEFGACGLAGRSPDAGNVHFYAGGSMVPSPRVEIPDGDELSDADWEYGDSLMAGYNAAKKGLTVEAQARIELPVGVEV